MTLREILARVNRSRASLTLLNADVPPETVADVHDYLDAYHVRVTQDQTTSKLPKNVALLHEDGEFRAASDLRTVARRADLEASLAAGLENVPVPDVLRAIDDRTFSEFGKRRMIVASREIEKRAYDVGEGSLYTGFQRLSLVRSQRRIYDALGDSGVDVHVFGYPDWEVPDSVGVETHPSEAEEVRRTWFVAFDGGGDDAQKGALLAEEVGENVYSGFWTYDAAIVDEIVARLTEISS